MSRHTTVNVMSDKESLDTTVGAVAETITGMVLDGRLKPRQKLNEVEYARELGISRNSLREAFRLLIRDGILVHHSHRGVFVRSYEPLEIHDLYDFRLFIECAAVEQYIPGDALSEFAARQMASIAQQGTDALDREDWSEASRLNNDFHMSIFTLSGNQRAMNLGRDILTQSRLIFLDSGCQPTAYREFMPSNHKIADALMAADVASARAELATLLKDMREYMLKAWNDEH